MIQKIKSIIAFIRSFRVECGCRACWKPANNVKKCLGNCSECKCSGKCKKHKH